MRHFFDQLQHMGWKVYAFVSALLLPIFPMMMTILFLLVADLITGVWASKRRREPITSHRLSMSITKALLYNIVIISSFLVEKYVMGVIPWTRIVSGFIAVVELHSIMENVNSLTGVNVWRAIKGFFMKRKDEYGDVFRSSMGDVNNRKKIK